MAEPRKHDADHISLPRSGSEDTPNKSSQGLPSQAPGRLVAPEIIRAMTPERRAEVEAALVAKLDLRMSVLILAYITNYLDRYALDSRCNHHISHKLTRSAETTLLLLPSLD